METCTFCNKPAGAPFRTWDKNGKIVHGCVADFHTGHLPELSETNRWHLRKEAKEIRRKNAKHLKSLGGK